MGGDKQNDQNVETANTIATAMTPIANDIAETYGVTFEGDIEVGIGNRDDMYVSIGNQEEESTYMDRLTYNPDEGDLNLMRGTEGEVLTYRYEPQSGEKIVEDLTDEEQKSLDDLVNTIIELKDTLEVIEYEEEVFELEEIVIVAPSTTTTTTTTLPIKEDFADEEAELDEVEIDSLPGEEGDSEVQLTDEEVAVIVEETENAVKEIVVIEIVEEEPIDTEGLSEEEVVAAEEKAQEVYEAKVAEVVKELPTEKKVEVVKEVAKANVQNLGNASKETKAVVKAVVQEVTKVETVAELNEEEKQAVGEVLGFSEETAAEDVEIIAEQAAKEENVATAVNEYVDRAIENKDVEDYTLADVVTEVQVEVFLENPVGALIDVNITEMDLGSLGADMTSDQRQKSKEVVVPVIIASQIIAQAGALMTRRF